MEDLEAKAKSGDAKAQTKVSGSGHTANIVDVSDHMMEAESQPSHDIYYLQLCMESKGKSKSHSNACLASLSSCCCFFFWHARWAVTSWLWQKKATRN